MRAVLILGGTGEARQLANSLNERGYPVISSLAGRTDHPLLPQGRVKIGGFGGRDGLARFIITENIIAVVDATHPFATQISAHAAAACQLTHTAYMLWQRPPWQPESPATLWQQVPDLASAVKILPQNAKIFLAIGRQNISPFFDRSDLSGMARVIKLPDFSAPKNWKYLIQHPHDELRDDAALMAKEGTTHLITRESGHQQVMGKQRAAQILGVMTIIIARPQKQAILHVSSVEGVCENLESIHTTQLQKE